MNIIKGELSERIKLNRARLSDPIYNPPELFKKHDEWPGDFEGRAILSLCSLYEAEKDDKEEAESIRKQLKAIFDVLPNFLNEHQYFGPVFNTLFVNEQQVAGNSWYLRGLIAYYKITGEEKYLKWVQQIIQEFLIPLAPYFNFYPLAKRAIGGVGGALEGSIINKWQVSTDVGCAFIMLDGYTAAYELTKDVELLPAIENIISVFQQTDFVGLGWQTHASLSATRGVLRFYRTTGNGKYLEYAKKNVNRYLDEGMTYDFANFNWFHRENSWTEPCCIIDSLILFKTLYELTNEEKYLDIFNKTYINSLRTFQRDNGGAGCSTCAHDEDYAIKPYLYEAFFCCTMRMGEGFDKIASFDLIRLSSGTYFIPYPVHLIREEDNNRLEIDADIYNSEKITIKTNKACKLAIYVPEGFSLIKKYSSCQLKGNRLFVEITRKGSFDFEYNISVNRKNNLKFYGDMLLTKKDGAQEGKTFIIDGEEYSYLNDNRKFTKEELEKTEQHF